MKTFGHGMFYGETERRRRVDAIELAELQPTVPEHAIETHTHSDAHFVLVLSGRYLSSARGMPAISRGPALVYNPPGTTHRDCFRGLDGARFLTVSLPAAAVAGRALPEDAVRADVRGELAALALRSELHCWDDVSALAIDAGVQALFDTLERRRRLEADDGPAWLVRARETLAPSLQARVMIIEDETIIAWHLSEIVSELGCTVIGVVRTRAEAVAMAAQTEPELILADISLADRSSGLDAIRDILADRAVPAIFITAFPERLLTGERPEPTYLITKPFEPATVSATIWQALLVHRERERGRLPKVA